VILLACCAHRAGGSCGSMQVLWLLNSRYCWVCHVQPTVLRALNMDAVTM
jgi:hypothetical protein